MTNAIDNYFDPYYKWLGIPPQEQPPNYYRLLGVTQFEDDPDVIAVAADRQMGHIKSFAAGRYAGHSQRLLNELAKARLCLLNSSQKSKYDKQLRDDISAESLEHDFDDYFTQGRESVSPPTFGVESSQGASTPIVKVVPYRNLKRKIGRKRSYWFPLILILCATVAVVVLLKVSVHRSSSTISIGSTSSEKTPTNSIDIAQEDRLPSKPPAEAISPSVARSVRASELELAKPQPDSTTLATPRQTLQEQIASRKSKRQNVPKHSTRLPSDLLLKYFDLPAIAVRGTTVTVVPNIPAKQLRLELVTPGPLHSRSKHHFLFSAPDEFDTRRWLVLYETVDVHDEVEAQNSLEGISPVAEFRLDDDELIFDWLPDATSENQQQLSLSILKIAISNRDLLFQLRSPGLHAEPLTLDSESNSVEWIIDRNSLEPLPRVNECFLRIRPLNLPRLTEIKGNLDRLVEEEELIATLENSSFVGLRGSWTRAGQILKVKLSFEYELQCFPGDTFPLTLDQITKHETAISARQQKLVRDKQRAERALSSIASELLEAQRIRAANPAQLAVREREILRVQRIQQKNTAALSRANQLIPACDSDIRNRLPQLRNHLSSIGDNPQLSFQLYYELGGRIQTLNATTEQLILVKDRWVV